MIYIVLKWKYLHKDEKTDEGHSDKNLSGQNKIYLQHKDTPW